MSEKEARRQFGRALAALREARGLYQKELAGKAKLHVSTVSKYERGAITPRLEALRRLSEVLETSVDALIGTSAAQARAAAVAERLGRVAELIGELPDIYRAGIRPAFDEAEVEIRKVIELPKRGLA
jgi:transcriptional regulator with XRE-family HTH domain